MKIRDLIKRLKELNCVPLRMKGSHQTWRTPGGTGTFVLTVNNPGVPAAEVILSKVRRALKNEGIKLDE